MDNYLKTLLDTFGTALKEADAVVEYTSAREAYMQDTEVTAAVNEYNVQRMLLEEQQIKPDADATLIESIEARVNKLYDKIMASDNMKRLAAAENQLNALLAEINKEIMGYIIPDSGESCGGDCHHCHGCH
ncbi:MAG: YlbF family regulator [Clostridia bacterium]|nr:YlbF family regulator [Clostridia bacterium]